MSSCLRPPQAGAYAHSVLPTAESSSGPSFSLPRRWSSAIALSRLLGVPAYGLEELPLLMVLLWASVERSSAQVREQWFSEPASLGGLAAVYSEASQRLSFAARPSSSCSRRRLAARLWARIAAAPRAHSRTSAAADSGVGATHGSARGRTALPFGSAMKRRYRHA